VTSDKNIETMRKEIAERVAAFRERQQKFNQSRDDYFKRTTAKLRADISRLGPTVPPKVDAPLPPLPRHLPPSA